MMKEEQKWVDEAVKQIRSKMKWVSKKNKDKIPYTTGEDGSYDDRSDNKKAWNIDDGLNWWTNGFWGGLMWLLYQDTKDEDYADYARLCETKLESCFSVFYGLHHDVGFMYQLTAVADYELTGNEDSRKTAMHAANLLAGRFNPKGKFIRAWNDDLNQDTRGWAIIDCMMNISLLYWASRESEDPRFKHIAMMHADTVMKAFIREDGSSYHIVEFDPETGRRFKAHGGQGYSEDSAWTRGQGWAIYGFMISYIHTGKQEYLDTAINVANYCIKNISNSGIIPIDFRQPETPSLEDSCGACVIAVGLLHVAEHVSDDKRQIYYDNAVKILRTIYDTRADFSDKCDAIVQNCSAAYHIEEHHVTMNYADYFFIEGIHKLAGIGKSLW